MDVSVTQQVNQGHASIVTRLGQRRAQDVRVDPPEPHSLTIHGHHRDFFAIFCLQSGIRVHVSLDPFLTKLGANFLHDVPRGLAKVAAGAGIKRDASSHDTRIRSGELHSAGYC